MLPVIDARTLFVASAVVFAGLAISVALAWRELKSLSGPDRFAKSYAFFLVGLLLFALQGRISPVLSYWLANVLVVVGAALVLEGTKLILGRPPGRRITVATGLAATAAFGYYTLVRFDTDARTILSSAFVAGLLGAAGWTAWHRRPRTGPQTLERVTAIALGACALLFWARAVAIGTGLVGGEMLDSSPWMAVPPLLCTLCAVVWTTTLLANTSRRLTNVVQSQNDLLANLLSVARAAGDESNLDATLERVLTVASDLTGAAGASLLMLDEEGRFIRGFFTHEATNIAVEAREAEIILEKGLAAWVVHHRTAGIVVDVNADPRWHKIPGPGGADPFGPYPPRSPAGPPSPGSSRSSTPSRVTSARSTASCSSRRPPRSVSPFATPRSPMRASGRHAVRSSSTRSSRSRRAGPTRRRSSRSPRTPCRATKPGIASTSRSRAKTGTSASMGKPTAFPTRGRESTRESSAGRWRAGPPSTTTPRPAQTPRTDAGAASRFRSGTSAELSVSPPSRARGPAPSGPRTSIWPRRWPRPSASASARPPSPRPARS